MTEHIEAGDPLRASASQLRAVIDTIPDAVFQVDRDYRLVFANEGYVRATTATQGRAVALGESLLASDYSPGVIEAWRGYIDRAFAGESFTEELSFPLAGGTYDTENHFSPVRGADGEVTGVVVTSRDVTERRRLEGLLDDERLRFKLLVENSTEAVLMTQPDGTVLSANPAACRMFGRSEEELRRLGRAGLVDVSDPRLAASLEERARTWRASGEVRLVRSDGTTFPAQVSTSVYADHLGNERTSTIVRDLSERKAAEATLHESEAMRTIAEEIAQVGSFSWDIASGRSVWSPEMYRLFDLTPEEFDGDARVLLDTRIHPDDRALVEEATARAAKTGEPTPVEFRVVWRDGTERILRSAARTSHDADGAAIALTGYYQDVSEQRRAETTLRESETKYRIAADSTYDWEWWTAPDGSYVYVSPGCEGVTGHTADEFLADADLLEAIAHPDDRDRVREHMSAVAFDEREPQELTFRVRVPSGDERVIEHRCKPVYGDDGTYLGRRGTNRDITEQKRLEEELRSSEANFRAFFDTADDIIVVATPEGRLVYANPALSARLGYSAAEVGELHVLDLNPAERRAEAEAIFAAILRGERETCPLPLQTKSGALIPVETRVWFGRWNGVDCMFGVCKDLTREQEALQKFDRLFRNSPALMAVSSLPDGRFTEANDAFLSTLGYSREEVLGHTPDELGLAVDLEQQRVAEEQLQAQGRASDRELKVRCKDGSILDGLFSGEIIESQGQQYSLTVMVDQTERMRAEEKLRQSEEQLASAVDGSGVGLWDWHPQTGEETFSERWAEILGYTLAELAPTSIETWRRLSHPDDLRRADELLEEHFAGTSAIYSCEGRMRHKDGHWVWVLDRGRVSEWDADGRPLRMIGTELDISGRKRAEEELRLTRFIVERGDDGIFWMTTDGALRYANPSTCELLGYSLDELCAMTIHDIDPDFPAARWPQHIRELEEAGSLTFETRHRTRDGTIVPMEITATYLEYDGDVYDVAFARDIRERRVAEKALADLHDELVAEAAALAEANATITRVAATDDLTGLANRRHFYAVMGKAVSLARRHGSPLALVSIDLDGMKGVNDSAGHEAGDKVLTSFAALLADLCRAEDLPARLGGDEFSVLLPGNDLDGARGFAERVLAAVRACEVLARHGVTVSGGVARWTADELPEGLLRRADAALYAAKRGGGDRVAADG